MNTPNNPSSVSVRFQVIRLHLSKGDIAFEEPMAIFDTETEAKAYCDEKLRDPSTTPRWPDYDEYRVFPMTACPICSALANREEGRQKFGWPEHDIELPPAVHALAVAKDFRPGAERQRKILRCPCCDACFLFETDYEYLTNGSENEQHLTRLTPAQAADLLRGSP